MKALFPVLLLLSPCVWAVDTAQQFHQAALALHTRLIAQQEIRTEQEQGDYQGAAAARYRYIDTRYYDAKNGRLLSRVRRDAADADLVHIVEVNVYENGKLMRDFGSITLPWAPLHPVRTMINLHHYAGALHSFRQFNVYGEVTYEFCEGNLAGKRVNLSLDGADSSPEKTTGAEYRACFEGMSRDWQRYVMPQ